MDIIILGNADDVNHVLVNGGNGSFDDGMDFPDGHHGTYSKTADDINNDGIVHIIIGNKQALINTGNCSFGNVMDLPDGSMRRHSVVL